MSLEQQKQAAAVAAAGEARSGMVVGLGTGSTAAFAIDEIGRRVARGELHELTCVSTSRRTTAQATALGLRLVPIHAVDRVDLALDGADEIGPDLGLIKGLGGALLWEKRVERKAARFIVMADPTKCVRRLGERAPVPVEVQRAQAESLLQRMSDTGGVPRLRMDGAQPFCTDEGNSIIDLHFEPSIADVLALAATLESTDGVIDHGLFLGMATEACVSFAQGVRWFGRGEPWPPT